MRYSERLAARVWPRSAATATFTRSGVVPREQVAPASDHNERSLTWGTLLGGRQRSLVVDSLIIDTTAWRSWWETMIARLWNMI